MGFNAVMPKWKDKDEGDESKTGGNRFLMFTEQTSDCDLNPYI